MELRVDGRCESITSSLLIGCNRIYSWLEETRVSSHFGITWIYAFVYEFHQSSLSVSDPLGKSSWERRQHRSLVCVNILCAFTFLCLWQAQRNERESIRQKLALGSFYDDEPVIYTSCSKNGPSSRCVWLSVCVCVSKQKRMVGWYNFEFCMNHNSNDVIECWLYMSFWLHLHIFRAQWCTIKLNEK